MAGSARRCVQLTHRVSATRSAFSGVKSWSVLYKVSGEGGASPKTGRPLKGAGRQQQRSILRQLAIDCRAANSKSFQCAATPKLFLIECKVSMPSPAQSRPRFFPLCWRTPRLRMVEAFAFLGLRSMQDRRNASVKSFSGQHAILGIQRRSATCLYRCLKSRSGLGERF